MSSTGARRTIVRFGGYQCDLLSGELQKNGAMVHLAGQPLQLLTILLERPGEVVTRQELQGRLWPGQSYGEFEGGLNTAVNKLRTALDDKAETPKFIETIPRRGYRFVAKLDMDGEKPQESGVEADGRADAAGGAVSLLRRAVAGIAVAGGLFALWWFNPLPPPQVTHIEQVTFNSHIDTPVKPVMDGGRVYYLARDGDHWNLMQTSLGGGDGQRIPAPAPNAAVLAVSISNSRLLLGTFHKRQEEDQLWTAPAPGAATARLGSTTASGAAFSPDGQQIAYVHNDALWVMDAEGTNPHKLAEPLGGASWLAWSPDGRWLRFTEGPLLQNAENSLWEINPEGGNLHAVLPGWTHPATECCGAWTPDGRYYIFTSSHSGRMNLWALRERGSIWRRSPRGPFQLTNGPGEPFGGTPSRDGRHVYFYNGNWREELQSFDPATRQFRPFFTGALAMHVNFSRDGQWICYVNPQEGSIFRSHADGTGEQIEVVGQGLGASFPRWSPDGNWITFQGVVRGQPVRVYVVPAKGGQPEPLLESRTDVRDADWSSDGKSLVVSRDLEAGDPAGSELLVVDFATRHAEKIPGSEGLAMSRWSPDGRYISATGGGQSLLKLWDVAAKQWRVIAHGTAFGIGVWSSDSRYLYFQDLLGKGEPLSRYDVRRQLVEPVAEFSDILKSGVDRCGLWSMTPTGEPLLNLNRSALDLFAAEVKFP